MKKTIYASIILISLSPLWATCSFYYGGGLGIGQNNSFESTNSAVFFTATSLGSSSLQAQSFMGFSKKLNENFTLSFQLDMGYDTLSNRSAIFILKYYGVILRSGLFYGTSLRLSSSTNKHTPYLLLGVRGGQWSLSYSNLLNSTNTHGHQPVPALDTILFAKTLYIPELGIGMLFDVTDTLDGQFEYKYSLANTFRKSVDSTSWGATSTDITIRQHSVQVSLKV